MKNKYSLLYLIITSPFIVFANFLGHNSTSGLSYQQNYDYCVLTKKYLSNENLGLVEEVPREPIKNFNSEACNYRSSSCCSRFVEKIIAAKQIIQYESTLSEVIGELRREFDQNAQNLHDAIILSIRQSGYNLNTVFNKTYGIVYEKNVDLFYHLFTRLEDYISFDSLQSGRLKILETSGLEPTPKYIHPPVRSKRNLVASYHHQPSQPSSSPNHGSLYVFLKSLFNLKKQSTNGSSDSWDRTRAKLSQIRNKSSTSGSDSGRPKRFLRPQNRDRNVVKTANSVHSSTSLNSVVGSFFVDIYLRMFTLLNPQYHFDEARLACVKGSYNKVRPFGGSGTSGNDEPARDLTIHVTRSLGAAKSLLYVLTEIPRTLLDVRDFVNRGSGRSSNEKPKKNVSSTDPFWLSKIIHLDESLKTALMTLWGCPVCDPMMELIIKNGSLPCPEFCKAVVKHSLRHISTLSQSWNNFIESALKVVNRLQGPFSVEDNIDTLDVKISEAVMNFQENSLSFSHEIFKTCGQPPLKSYDSEISPSYPNKDTDIVHAFKATINGTLVGIPSVTQGLKNIENLLKNAKHYWKDLEQSLTFKLCPNFMHSINVSSTVRGSEVTAQIVQCWNGTNQYIPSHNNQNMNSSTQNDTKSSNDGKGVKWSFQYDRVKNPLILDIINQNDIILKSVTQKLNQAFHGTSFSIPDDDETSLPPPIPTTKPVTLSHVRTKMLLLAPDDESAAGGSGSGSDDEDDVHYRATTIPPKKHPIWQQEMDYSNNKNNAENGGGAPLVSSRPSTPNPISNDLSGPSKAIIYDLEMGEEGSGERENMYSTYSTKYDDSKHYGNKNYDSGDNFNDGETGDGKYNLNNKIDEVSYRKRNHGRNDVGINEQNRTTSSSHAPGGGTALYRFGLALFMLGVVLVP